MLVFSSSNCLCTHLKTRTGVCNVILKSDLALTNWPISARFVCVSVNRLTLHLRSYTSDSDSGRVGSERALSLAFAAKRQRRNSWLGTSTFEVPDAPSGQSNLEMFDMSTGG